MRVSTTMLVEAFRDAALFQIEQIRRGGWRWSSNYLREHVRCATPLEFSNSRSPVILRKLVERYPEFKQYIVTGPIKDPRQLDLFSQPEARP